MLIAERIPLDELSSRGESSSFLQTAFWARHKERFGWKSEAIRWKREDQEGTLLILLRTLPAGLVLAYVPEGPDWTAGKEDRETFLVELSQELRGILPLGCFFIRYDLPEFSVFDEPAPSFNTVLKKAPLDIQPPDTVVLDLSQGYEPLLRAMRKKTRYNIGLAAKKGVRIEKAHPDRLDDWYSLYRITAQRDKIGIHPFAYYENLFSLLSENKESRLELFLASFEEELLAGIIVLFHKNEATYLYGASSNEKRNLMPAYALQSFALKEAVSRGCTTYDMFGIPPSNDPDHPMAGLYRFKTGFGGEIRHKPGAWDYPYSRLLYLVYRLLESMRKFYHKRWKKR
ncbi:peptidoglycan bridge formation glycyltransferase FemA/FemB family protein [Oceanispirochaeta crateris]|uniref:Peptidoglycan bridge formation glycyltransferase FemA/FemB family protein n=1 Tax=Oceanispirochaeta crateris TaxID=2518645 RepID=A0A5C1QFV5_9SPIO|nr:peptidoglycan bridge formation glycyltransferase FemA/FemB family protein [Oceanispirochaeta crateris]QEN07043.1 peptidoglycan bridge formation glycyltransferase FemA/FemB family protein [Oceanispirochaeta crateris]